IPVARLQGEKEVSCGAIHLDRRAVKDDWILIYLRNRSGPCHFSNESYGADAGTNFPKGYPFHFFPSGPTAPQRLLSNGNYSVAFKSQKSRRSGRSHWNGGASRRNSDPRLAGVFPDSYSCRAVDAVAAFPYSSGPGRRGAARDGGLFTVV